MKEHTHMHSQRSTGFALRVRSSRVLTCSHVFSRVLTGLPWQSGVLLYIGFTILGLRHACDDRWGGFGVVSPQKGRFQGEAIGVCVSVDGSVSCQNAEMFVVW